MAERNPFDAIPCRNCGHTTLRLEWRTTVHAKPLGTHSLSGAQMKTTAVSGRWPWCVCDHCGAECAGKFEGDA